MDYDFGLSEFGKRRRRVGRRRPKAKGTKRTGVKRRSLYTKTRSTVMVQGRRKSIYTKKGSTKKYIRVRRGTKYGYRALSKVMGTTTPRRTVGRRRTRKTNRFGYCNCPAPNYSGFGMPPLSNTSDFMGPALSAWGN